MIGTKGKGLRIVITGGSGFIGTNLVEHFSANGNQVLNLDILPPRNQAHNTYWGKVDLLDAAALQKSIHAFQPDFILHMGARTDLDGKSLADYAANTTGVSNLLGVIEGLTTLRRVIFASSRLVCKIGYQPDNEFDYCPTTPYGESKVIGEKIVREAANKIPCPWVIVRPTSIWGPWFDVPYKTFFMTIAKGRYVHPGHAKILKSFGFVGNTVHQLVSLLNADPVDISGKTLYLADYPPIDVAEMADTIQHAEKVRPIQTAPVALLRVAACAGDVLKRLGYANPPLTSFRLNNLLTPMVHDLEPLKAVVGELPYTMSQGVDITVAWLRQREELG